MIARRGWSPWPPRVRPELHRYCARLMGSVIDGEDVVQDTLLRALVALQDLEDVPPLRPWLFRVPITAPSTSCTGDRCGCGTSGLRPGGRRHGHPDPLEMLMRQEAVKTAVSRFADFPYPAGRRRPERRARRIAERDRHPP